MWACPSVYTFDRLTCFRCGRPRGIERSEGGGMWHVSAHLSAYIYQTKERHESPWITLHLRYPKLLGSTEAQILHTWLPDFGETLGEQPANDYLQFKPGPSPVSVTGVDSLPTLATTLNLAAVGPGPVLFHHLYPRRYFSPYLDKSWTSASVIFCDAHPQTHP